MHIEYLPEVVQILETQQFPYMISGSAALGLYVTPRMTFDIDIVIQLRVKDVDRFVDAFENVYIDKIMILEELQRSGMFNIIDFKTGMKVDFIPLKADEYSRVAFARRVRHEGQGVSAWWTSLEDLILAKLIWIQVIQGNKQLEDLRLLIARNDVNWDYIHFWREKLNLNTFTLF